MSNLVASAVRQGLYTHVVGKRILYYNELESTMDKAARLAEDGADEGTVVIAERQSAGRGRQGRSWVSQPGNLLLSIVFRPNMEQLPFISPIGGVAAARAVRKATGLAPRIKWPNDLMLDSRKAAGILAESAIAGDSVCYAVLGLGINIALDVAEIDGISSIATSVNAAAGHEVERQLLLRQLLLELDDLYIQLGRNISPVEEWRDLIETIGRRVTAVSGTESNSGFAEGVDEIGNLQLRLDDGRLITLTSGDVTLGVEKQD
jgi:BirA family biotin operon repressor/biotin-[acetyl-CoA-carboxylase] ligase